MIGEFVCKLESCLTDADGSVVVAIRVEKPETASVEQVVKTIKKGRESGKERLKMQIAWDRKKRSLDANAYMWSLITKIADSLGVSSQEIYRKFIREQRVFKDIVVSDNGVSTFITAWGMNGIGWLAERVDKAEHKGFSLVRAYYGSSVYSTKQMAELVDSVVEEARTLGIETLAERELKELVARHGL